jgi:hypothetical protein
MGILVYLTSETHYLCERREYVFNILPKYFITSRKPVQCTGNFLKKKLKNLFYIDYVNFLKFIQSQYQYKLA